jgi:hypothetical protein
MSIKSKVSQAIEKEMREKRITVPEGKEGKYNSFVHELEQKTDSALQHAFDDLRDGVGRLGSEIGVDLSSLRDKVVKEVRDEIPKDN